MGHPGARKAIPYQRGSKEATITTRRQFTQYFLGAGALAVALSGCGSGISVTSDWDPNPSLTTTDAITGEITATITNEIPEIEN